MSNAHEYHSADDKKGPRLDVDPERNEQLEAALNAYLESRTHPSKWGPPNPQSEREVEAAKEAFHAGWEASKGVSDGTTIGSTMYGGTVPDKPPMTFEEAWRQYKQDSAIGIIATPRIYMVFTAGWTACASAHAAEMERLREDLNRRGGVVCVYWDSDTQPNDATARPGDLARRIEKECMFRFGFDVDRCALILSEHDALQRAKTLLAAADAIQRRMESPDIITHTCTGTNCGGCELGRAKGLVEALTPPDEQAALDKYVRAKVEKAVPKFSILDALEALEYAGEGRTNSVKPDLLANFLNKRAANRAAVELAPAGGEKSQKV
jgi:hypothetical protein